MVGKRATSKLRRTRSLRARSSALERVQARSRRLAAVYSALATVHKVASEARSSAELYSGACNTLVKDDVYHTAWWGRIARDGSLQIAVVAGHTPVPPPTSLVPRGQDDPWLQAIGAGIPVIIRDDASAEQVRADAVVHGFGLSSAIMVPVSVDATRRGVLCVGSVASEAFDADEAELLLELGRSLTTHAERIAAERAFAAQRELLRAVFDCASYGMYYVNAEGTLLVCNEAFLRLTGGPQEAVVGKSFQSNTAPEHVEVERDIVRRVMADGLASEYDKDLVRTDGFRIPVRLSVAPVRDRSGRPVGTVTVVRDIVAEREAAKALRESEERYRAAFRNNPDAIFVVDGQGSIVDANPAALALTQLDRDALVTRHITDLAPEADRREHGEAFRDLVKDGCVYRPHLRFMTAGGDAVQIELHGTTLGPTLWQVLARDIGARLEAENKLIALKDMLEEKVAARTSELLNANEALARAAKMKDQFLANMSHELRTPLNSVLGLAEALLDGVYGDLDEQQKQILMTMRDSGRHLLDLINDILDLSKIDAGRLELDLRSISVSEVCQVSLRMIRPLALAKRIGTWMRTDPRLSVVVADERRLKQMLVNLLSNAVKFTPAGGQAGIEVWSHGEWVYFSVTDTGIGISPPDLRRIFEPFTQIDSSLSRQHDGTGLGLALVRRLAELHGGRVDVDSEPGRGSRFTIVLPLVDPPERDSLPPEETG